MKKYMLCFIVVILLTGCVGDVSNEPYYSIGGRVLDEHGNGLQGVAIRLEGKSAGIALTNWEGEWTANVRGTATVTPYVEGATFSPRSRTVNQHKTNMNFEAVIGKITGRVVVNGESPGQEIRIIVNASQDRGTEIFTDASGYYELPLQDYLGLGELSLRAEKPNDYNFPSTAFPFSTINVSNISIRPGRLPDIDLYGYGVGLIYPAPGTERGDLPMDVVISPYDRDVDVAYRFYFGSIDPLGWLGYSDEFTGSTFHFSGQLSTGRMLDVPAHWSLQLRYVEDGVSFQMNTYILRYDL